MNKKTILIALVTLVVGLGLGWSYSNVSAGKSLRAMQSSAQALPKDTGRMCPKGEDVEMGEHLGCYYGGRIHWIN